MVKLRRTCQCVSVRWQQTVKYLEELTLLFRFLHGIQAEDTARLLLDLGSGASSTPSTVPGSSFGLNGRGGITTNVGESKLRPSEAVK